MIIENPGPAYMIVLDKAAIPPEKPHLTSAVATEGSVTLTWEDRSDNESGFVVWRRDKLSGIYSNVQDVAVNATSCTNSVYGSGFYWYRIAATNSAGISRGSNVKRVVVP
ncbi:MAG: fibronectin type III domain-containing protein [Spartobacteria bacterium]|nr:fibronectin type III domain-containing protein [Spartobacteria bacterium]